VVAGGKPGAQTEKRERQSRPIDRIRGKKCGGGMVGLGRGVAMNIVGLRIMVGEENGIGPRKW